MNPLAYFRWYRRARGGFWAQVTSPFFGKRWLRCRHVEPSLDLEWEFWPRQWRTVGSTTLIDEWHSVEPCYAVPLSRMLTEKIGTADPEKLHEMLATTYDEKIPRSVILLWNEHHKSYLNKSDDQRWDVRHNWRVPLNQIFSVMFVSLLDNQPYRFELVALGRRVSIYRQVP